LTAGYILPRAGVLFRVRCSLCPAPSSSAVDRSRLLGHDRAPSGVSCSLFATSVRGVHLSRGAPSSTLRSVLGVPPALDGLLRHVPCGLVPSHSHVQGLPSRGDHTAEPCRVVPGRCPPVVGRPRLQPKLRRQDTPSPSGLCSPRWVRRSPTGGETHPNAAPLLGFVPPPGNPEPNRRHAFTCLPPSVFLHEEPFVIDPRRLTGSALTVLEPDRSARSRFLA
jgi:hypothetical protein